MYYKSRTIINICSCIIIVANAITVNPRILAQCYYFLVEAKPWAFIQGNLYSSRAFINLFPHI